MAGFSESGTVCCSVGRVFGIIGRQTPVGLRRDTGVSLSHRNRFLLPRLRVDAGNALPPQRSPDDQFALQPARPVDVAASCIFGGAIVVLDVFAMRNPISRPNRSLLGCCCCFSRFFHCEKCPIGVVRRFAPAPSETRRLRSGRTRVLLPWK